MATGLVRCDHCEKCVKQQDAHGWLEVKVWVTKPTAEGIEQMKQDPVLARLLESQGIEGADLPALVGGDFCCMDHIIKFYESQRTLETMETTETPLPKDASYAEKEEAFERWLEERQEPPPPMIHREPPDAPDDFSGGLADA